MSNRRKLILGALGLLLTCCLLSFLAAQFGNTEDQDPTAQAAQIVAEQETAVVTQELQPTATSLMSPTAESQSQAALVIRIIDGDTIEVEINGRNRRLRYIGMDTPERGTPFFDQATEANRQLVAGQTVQLVKDVSETDRFGRLLRYVYLPDGTFVNAELVRQGYAQVATFPPDVAHQDTFLALQQEARDAGRGLWQTAVPQAPTNTPPPPPATDTPLPSLTDTPVLQPTNPPPVDTPVPPPTEPPPAAPADVQITSIFYDGLVSRVESDEYAVITNQGGSPVNIGGWRLNAGNPGQDFTFSTIELQPGQSCRVYTNEVHQETCGLSFGSGSAIWNNEGDCGYLYDANGAEVSRYCYG